MREGDDEMMEFNGSEGIVSGVKETGIDEGWRSVHHHN